MEFKMPLYSGIHKGQRRWLADLVMRSGRTDFTKLEELEPLIDEMKAFTEHLRQHADLEERFIHPTLGGIVPGCPRDIEAQHKAQHQNLEDLIASLEMIKGMPRDHEALPRIGHEQYLALNRFISTYLGHIDFEEDHVQQILFNDCTAEELMTIFKNIITAQSPPDLMTNLKVMLLGMNLPETIGVFRMASTLMPDTEFQRLTGEASKFIEPERWKIVQAQLGRH
jgi:hypothetical protein